MSEKPIPELPPADRDLHEVAAEHAATLPETPPPATPLLMFQKALEIRRITDAGLRRRALIALSVDEVSSLVDIVTSTFPVAQAAANWMVTRAVSKGDTQAVFIAEAQLETWTNLILDKQSHEAIRRASA